MRIELVDPQSQLLEEIGNQSMKRKDVALTYAFAIRQQDEVSWPKVNKAIIERWSLAGLKWIQVRAWRIAEDDACIYESAGEGE